jgi:hypothetical protein
MLAVLIAALLQADKMNWKANYDEALKEAKEKKRLLVVHFSTEW